MTLFRLKTISKVQPEMGIARPTNGRDQPGVRHAPSSQNNVAMAQTTRNMLQRKSIIDLADDSGLFSINPSDLVYEMNHATGPSYYDFVLSCSTAGPSKRDGCCLYLAKFDSKVSDSIFSIG